MVDRSATRTDESRSDDDFEWVNAWAESAVIRESKDEPAALMRKLATTTASPTEPRPNDEALTPAPVLSAPGEVPLVPAAIALAAVQRTAAVQGNAAVERTAAAEETAAAEPIESQAPDERIEAVEPQDTGDCFKVSAIDDATGPAEAPDTLPPKAPTWLERKPWTRILRIVARNPDSSLDPAAAVTREEPEYGPCAAADAAHEAPEPGAPELMPIADHVELAPEHLELAPDQLERDIAEIELIRDQLLAEPAELAARFDDTVASAPSRTSDHVPILVGGALAFTLLVVFGAAASLVSLR